MASSVTLSWAAALAAGSSPAGEPLGSACFCGGKAKRWNRGPSSRPEGRYPGAQVSCCRVFGGMGGAF